MVHGELKGIKKSYIDELNDLYNIRVEKNLIIDKFILNKIAEISLKINREICVIISRSGIVYDISVGTQLQVSFDTNFRERKKLSGYRVIHTHLNSSCKLSDIDISSLKKLRLDVISAVNITNEKLLDSFSIGFLSHSDKQHYTEIFFDDVDDYFKFDIYSVVHKFEKSLEIELYDNEFNETAVLIGCDSQESLQELNELALACRVDVHSMFFQKRDKIDAAYYVGKGKLHEILRSIYHSKVNVLIFDEELSASQVRNIEDIFRIKVLDRTSLILEIFARRAKSKISKYQVELAQLNYRYSRLRGLGLVLSRTGGGIGTRGPGEKKLETDRRHIKNRINYLQEQIKTIKSERSIQRDLRIRNQIPQIAIVGYTNAGKSTLRNFIYSICGEKISEDKFVYENDMVFVTLDTTTRKIILPSKMVASLTDTVGFIKKLPHDLVEAFKSTLEEIIFSDLIIHVVDISSSTWRSEIDTTNLVLEELGLKNFNRIFVFNKIDKVSDIDFNTVKKDIHISYGDDVVFISATHRINIDLLLELIGKNLNVKRRIIKVSIPYSEYSVLNSIYNKYTIISEQHLEECTVLEFDINENEMKKYEKYMINDLEK